MKGPSSKEIELTFQRAVHVSALEESTIAYIQEILRQIHGSDV